MGAIHAPMRLIAAHCSARGRSFEAVLDKYMEYQTEDLGDLFMRSMLHDSGVEVKATSRERKRKRK